MAHEPDRVLYDKAIDLTASTLRGAMGREGSQPASYAADLFREIWGALRDGLKDLPDKPKTGF